MYVSTAVASVTSAKAEYINTVKADDEFYVRQIIGYLLAQFGGANRQEIDKTFTGQAERGAGRGQEKTKIGNLLTGIRESANLITNVDTARPSMRC